MYMCIFNRFQQKFPAYIRSVTPIIYRSTDFIRTTGIFSPATLNGRMVSTLRTGTHTIFG